MRVAFLPLGIEGKGEKRSSIYAHRLTYKAQPDAFTKASTQFIRSHSVK